MEEGLKREVGMLECVHCVRLENLPSSYVIHETPKDTSFTKVKMNALVMGIPVLSRSSATDVL